MRGDRGRRREREAERRRADPPWTRQPFKRLLEKALGEAHGRLIREPEGRFEPEMILAINPDAPTARPFAVSVLGDGAGLRDLILVPAPTFGYPERHVLAATKEDEAGPEAIVVTGSDDGPFGSAQELLNWISRDQRLEGLPVSLAAASIRTVASHALGSLDFVRTVVSSDRDPSIPAWIDDDYLRLLGDALAFMRNVPPREGGSFAKAVAGGPDVNDRHWRRDAWRDLARNDRIDGWIGIQRTSGWWWLAALARHDRPEGEVKKVVLFTGKDDDDGTSAREFYVLNDALDWLEERGLSHPPFFAWPDTMGPVFKANPRRDDERRLRRRAEQGDERARESLRRESDPAASAVEAVDLGIARVVHGVRAQMRDLAPVIGRLAHDAVQGYSARSTVGTTPTVRLAERASFHVHVHVEHVLDVARRGVGGAARGRVEALVVTVERDASRTGTPRYQVDYGDDARAEATFGVDEIRAWLEASGRLAGPLRQWSPMSGAEARWALLDAAEGRP